MTTNTIKLHRVLKAPPERVSTKATPTGVLMNTYRYVGALSVSSRA